MSKRVDLSDRHDEIVDLYVNQQLSCDETAARLRLTRMSVTRHLARLGLFRANGSKGTKVRSCLACGEAFRSTTHVMMLCTTCCPDHLARYRWKRHKITQPQFETMLKEQHGCCAICAVALLEARPRDGNGAQVRDPRVAHVDHDHDTMKVRGLLCSNCNSGIGLLGDKAARVFAAAEYLSRNA